MSGMIPENGRMGERGLIGICHQEPELTDRVEVEEGVGGLMDREGESDS